MRWYQNEMRRMAEQTPINPIGDFKLYVVGRYDSDSMSVDFLQPERIVMETELEVSSDG